MSKRLVAKIHNLLHFKNILVQRIWFSPSTTLYCTNMFERTCQDIQIFRKIYFFNFFYNYRTEQVNVRTGTIGLIVKLFKIFFFSSLLFFMVKSYSNILCVKKSVNNVYLFFEDKSVRSAMYVRTRMYIE